MPINNKLPNTDNINEDIEQVSKILEQSVDSIDKLTLSSLYTDTAGKTRAGKFLSQRATILRASVNEIDKPILKNFALDMLNTMSSWFNDPEILCCLIQAIWVTYMSNQDLKTAQRLEIADTGFGDFLDKLIAFVDLIMAFVSRDLRSIVFFIPDFIKEIFGQLMGAILLVLQETLYLIRDSVLQSILDWIDESVDADNIFASCLPMQQFIDILKTYVSDYGLFNEIMEKIRGYISGKKTGFKNEFKALNKLNKDMEFLRWFRDLLIKLKRATINFDLCVEYTYIPDQKDDEENDPTIINNNDSFKDAITEKQNSTGIPAEDIVPVVISDDGRTIAVSDNDSRIKSSSKTDPNYQNINGTYISRISNDSIASFMKNNYNFSDSVIEQTLNRRVDGCPGFPDGEDLKTYLNKLKNRTI